MTSKYPIKPLSFDAVSTYPLATRKSKVHAGLFAKPMDGTENIPGFVAKLPHLLAGESLRTLIRAILYARASGKPIVWGLGGHVIKVGLGPVLIDLMRSGFVSAFAVNGSAAIHDFEIAFGGATSEEVEEQLGGGQFGMAHETGQLINTAIRSAADQGIGIGEGLGMFLAGTSENKISFKHSSLSILSEAYDQNVPVTVHVAIGTDIIHTHPAASGAALGKASFADFQLFCNIVGRLDGGGVYINVGSAVILPEVFLKAVAVVRNLGHPLEEFTTANLDFIQHYRPSLNVLKRPTQKSGQSVALTGHHEIMLPLIAAALKGSIG